MGWDTGRGGEVAIDDRDTAAKHQADRFGDQPRLLIRARPGRSLDAEVKGIVWPSNLAATTMTAVRRSDPRLGFQAFRGGPTEEGLPHAGMTNSVRERWRSRTRVLWHNHNDKWYDRSVHDT